MKAVVRTLKSQAGFSLIELMIVVAIIGILASIAVPNFQKFQRKAKQTEGKGYLASIYTSEKSFQAEWNSFSACVDAIGHVPEGKGLYTSGFAAGTISAVAGSTAAAACVTAQVPGTTVGFALSAGGAAQAKATLTGTDVGTANTFLAGSSGFLGSGALIDLWTMDQGKSITNQTSGL
jgi:type IV pilus assembly protein PilA